MKYRRDAAADPGPPRKHLFIWYETAEGEYRSAIVGRGGEYFKGVALIERHEFDAEYVNVHVDRAPGELLLKSLARHWPRPPAGTPPIYPLP